MFLGRTSNDVRPFTFLPQKRKIGEKISQCDKFYCHSPDLSQISAFVATKEVRKHPECFSLPEKPLPLHQLHNFILFTLLYLKSRSPGRPQIIGGDSNFLPPFIPHSGESRFSVSWHG